MSKEKVFAAAEAYIEGSNQHCVVLALDADKAAFEACGDSDILRALQDHPDVMEKLEKIFLDAAKNKLPETKLEPERIPRLLPKLFACPGSKLWKGVAIRRQLSRYLEYYGFGHNKSKKYGEGLPPPGWPIVVDWQAFKGPSKGYSFTLCTEIIKQMMEFQGLDPMDHYHKKDLPEPDDDQEMHEEAYEEPEPGPSKRKRVDPPRGRMNVLNTIRVIQEREDRENPILARQKINKEALKKVMQDGNLVEDYDL